MFGCMAAFSLANSGAGGPNSLWSQSILQPCTLGGVTAGKRAQVNLDLQYENSWKLHCDIVETSGGQFGDRRYVRR